MDRGCGGTSTKLRWNQKKKEGVCKFPSSVVIHKLNIGSYHCPLVVCLNTKKRKSKKPFRFEKKLGWNRMNDKTLWRMFGAAIELVKDENEYMTDLGDAKHKLVTGIVTKTRII